MWEEFKKFAFKGNVIDLAVAVVIGGAFGKIVTSLVNDIITPLIGLLLGGINFSQLAFPVGAAKVKIGLFIQSTIDFFLIAFSIILFVRFFNRFKRKEENPPSAEVKADKKEELLVEIRDLLKERT